MRNTYDMYQALVNPLPMILTHFFLFLIFHVFTFGITEGQPPPYNPEDNIALDCGSKGSKTVLDNRTWDGDINSKLFSLEDGRNKESITSSSIDQSYMGTDKVPYGTARLSLSEFTYKIPVTPGPKFVRLHFLATAYQNFNPTSSSAFFSVKAGQFTLLSNFSVFLTADALGRRDVVKEFCVAVKNSNLSISFTPIPSTPEAFAFINGIEVVSMPTDLYYPAAVESDRSPRLVGENSIYRLTNDSALETVYRINVGGYEIPPNRDTGMFRNWIADDAYLTNFGYALAPVEHALPLKFTMIPNYTAPEEVYRSAWSLGNKSRTLIESYNLTWEYPVDAGFYYLVRLHFCEIVKEMSKINDRVFIIYIANQTAERRADLILWTGGQYIPFKKDYVVSMFGKAGEKKLNLSVALHANPDSISRYADGILNGLEIFKLSDTIGNLAGPNPDPILIKPSAPTQPQKGNKKNNQTTTIAVVCGVVSGIVVLSVLGFFVIRRRLKSVKDSKSSDGTTWWGPLSFVTTKSSKTRGSSSLPSDLCRYFSLAEIKAATNDFDDIFVIGSGGFGNVYKGYIDDGTTPVAIKRLKSQSSQGAHEFKTEIEMLSHLRHRHLVSLIGYCKEDHEMILVYDYMARGTLRSHLYGTENPPISWKQRLEICIGAARGLHYLHTGAKYTIIHRDVKTTNILLDEKWVAKVSDFGLSKTGPTSMSKAHVSTVVKGSFGYLDPEYYRRQQLTEKSDVYSFGVVLCEVLCGRPPILRNAEKKQASLADWARSCFLNGMLNQIIDPHLTGQIAPECLKKYGEIAVNCMLDNGTERPSMNDVVWGLEFAMQLQKNAEENDRIGGAIMMDKRVDEVALLNTNKSDGSFTCSWEDMSGLKLSGISKMSSTEQESTTNESIKGMSGAVFSEINNPKAR